MRYLLYQLNWCICDNEEIKISDFNKLSINDVILDSKNLSNITSVKLSFIGTSVCKIRKIEGRNYKLTQISQSWGNDKKSNNIKVVVNFEKKIYGLIIEHWIFILIVLILSIILQNYSLTIFFSIIEYFY